MANPAINFAGFLYDDAGDAVSGATINLYDKNTSTTSRANTTTNSSGYWSIAHTTNGEFDVQITSGSSKRRIKFDDKIHLSEVDTETLNIRGNEGQPAPMYWFADDGDDAGDRWLFNAAAGGVFTMGNDLNSQGTYVAHVTITPNATVANSTFAVAGNVTVGNALDVDGITNLDAVDIDGAVQLDGTFTVGVDDTGLDVKFFGASAGAYMLYDQSEDQLVIMGASADATTSTGKLLLATSLTDVNANDVIGKIEFQAPHETGTDAITVAAAIEAVAQGTFAAAVNATDIIFKTGHSEAATEKFRITSQGELGIGGATYGSSGDVLTSGGAGAAPTWATPTTGDITGVTAGDGLSGGGSSGGVTVTLDLNELTAAAVADGDFIPIIDTNDSNGSRKEAVHDLATLFSGDGLAATNSVMAVDLGTNPGLEFSSNKLQIAKGISQHDVPQFAASVADNDFLRIDGTTVEGLSAAEVAAAIESSIDAVGTIATGVWQGTAVASAYLDADTAHLSGTQTFSGAKTFSDDITMAADKSLLLPQGGNVKFTDAITQDSIDDHDAQGIIMTFTAGMTVTPFSPVYLGTDDEVHECDADAIATMPCIGVSVNTSNVTDGNSIEVMLLGLIRDETFTDFGTNGAPVFVSTTVGEMTNTAPSGDDDVVQIIGHSVGEKLLFVQPSLTYLVVDA